MLTSSAFRDRLTQYCYQSNDSTDLGFLLEKALSQLISIDPLLKKLNKAIRCGDIAAHYSFSEKLLAAQQANILTADEATKLDEFEKLKSEIIKVNEFSFDLEKVVA